MKDVTSLLVGILFCVLGVPLIGVGAALPAVWIHPLFAAHPLAALFIIQLLYIVVPVAALGILFGAALGRIIGSCAIRFGLVAAIPYLTHAVWFEMAGPPAIFSRAWFIVVPVIAGAVCGLAAGVHFLGGGVGLIKQLNPSEGRRLG